MTAIQSYASLLRYHLHRSLQVWFILIVLGGQAIFMNYLFIVIFKNSETDAGKDMFGFGYILLFFSVVMVVGFLGGPMTGALSSRTWILANGEFLLIRPVSRFRICLTLLGLAFGVLMICPMINLVFTAFHPDLLISMANTTEVYPKSANRLSLYQQAFPDSSILHLPNRTHATLLVPGGAWMTSLWYFWQVILAGMLLQVLSLVRLPEDLQRKFQVGVCCLPAVIILMWRWIGSWIPLEKSFFFFVRHIGGLALLTLICFALLQVMTWRWIREIEAIS